MRTMLFVQKGAERPRCIGNIKGAATHKPYHVRVSDDVFVSHFQLRLLEAADRYWAVQAESAEHGRAVIEVNDRHGLILSCGESERSTDVDRVLGGS